MKFSKYFMLAGAAALLAACSSEEPLAPNENAMTAEIANADTYALFAVQMAEEAGTRTATPTTSNIPQEYQVVNGTILIFQASKDENATEGDATYVTRAQMATSWKNTDGTNPDVSRTAYLQVGFPKNTFKDGESYYACIVLNYPSGYTFPTAPNGETAGQTFSSWATTPQSTEFIYTVDNTTYMTMVSAPKYSDTKVYPVLAKIETKNIKKSMAELTEADAIKDVYVHRNAVKISLNARNNDENPHVYTIAENGTAYAGATVTIKQWAADVKAKTSSPIQNVVGLDLTPTHMHGANGIRCHWGKSADYDKTNLTLDAFNRYAFEATDKFKDYEYVKENTMPAKQQIENRTTSMILKAEYKSKGQGAMDLVKFGNIATLRTNDDALSIIKNKADALPGVDGAVVTKKVTTGGYYDLKDFCTIKVGDNELTPAQYKSIETELGLIDGAKIAYYAGGVCYYRILIRHFDDTEVPLGSTTISTADKYTDAHLGRYGVLRNNWYEVILNSISKIGEPEVPTPGTDPDDKPQDEIQAVSFSINMLNWAKRSQNADL